MNRVLRQYAVVNTTLLFCTIGLAPAAQAWERGLNAGSWSKGATLNVFIDPLPGDSPKGSDAAVDEAIKEWNDAQAPFGGLKLVRGATKANADIHVSWSKKPEGSVTYKKDGTDKLNNGFGKETVRMEISYDGLNSRGVTRDLKHEFGHAEGLGHSAKSDLMRENAYSKTKKGPTTDDLNSNAPFTEPTDDDKAGKKALWGTKEKLSRSTAGSQALFDGTKWTYQYQLQALNQAGLSDPITEFTVSLPYGVSQSDFTVTGSPSGWAYRFYDGTTEVENERYEDGEAPSPSLLSFYAISTASGLTPGSSANFELASLYGPGTSRAFTNSPNYDSDEFSVRVPVPEPDTYALLGLGMGLSIWLSRRNSR